MTTLHGFFIFQDHSLPTGSRIFAGSPIYCWVQRASISGQVNTDTNTRSNQNMEIELDTTTDNSSIGSMWNRRKSHVQVTGIGNLQLDLQGGWEVSQVGSAPTNFDSSTGSPVHLSPYAIVRMALSGHTFHLLGGTGVQSLVNGQPNDILAGTGTQVGSLYTGSGIPVIINSFNIEDTAEQEDFVSWGISLSEDRDRLLEA